jgi:hypothetical protein
MDKIKNILISIAVLIIVAVLLFVGYKIYPVFHKCPTIVPDTILVHDTIEHIIISEVPHYIIKKDTVIVTDTVFPDVDTFAILIDYYSIHKYTRVWEDSSIKATLKDEIQENAPYRSDFSYKLLKPQQVIINNIDNSITYSSYLTAGITLPFKEMKYTSIGLSYVNRRWYIGAGYMPDKDVKSLYLSGGATIVKFKKVNK